MFDFLKKKISSLFTGQEKKKKAKKAPAKKKSVKKEKKTKQPAKKVQKNKEEITLESSPAVSAQQIVQDLEEPQEIKAERELKEEIIEEKEEKQGFFARLIKKISSSKLKQHDFDEFFQEFEMTLLENNVALEAVDKIKDSLSKSLVGQEVRPKDAQKKVLDSLKKSILEILIEPPNLLEQIKSKQGIFTILFFGINGTGKTTSIAKLAYLLKKSGISSVLAAADTFRAASIEQLKKHGENLSIPVIHQTYGSDPAAVAFDAKQYAEKHNIKVVLIDTAGRMYTKANLLKEMEKIIRISQPDLKIFVGESITGNDAVDQAKTFNETAGIDGIILSKADVDEKAGAILSVSYVTKKPIYFLGTGQDYPDLLPFTKHTVLKNLGLE